MCVLGHSEVQSESHINRLACFHRLGLGTQARVSRCLGSNQVLFKEAGKEVHLWVMCDWRSSRKAPVPFPALRKSHWLEFHHWSLAYKDPLCLHRQDRLI